MFSELLEVRLYTWWPFTPNHWNRGIILHNHTLVINFSKLIIYLIYQINYNPLFVSYASSVFVYCILCIILIQWYIHESTCLNVFLLIDMCNKKIGEATNPEFDQVFHCIGWAASTTTLWNGQDVFSTSISNMNSLKIESLASIRPRPQPQDFWPQSLYSFQRKWPCWISFHLFTYDFSTLSILKQFKIIWF